MKFNKTCPECKSKDIKEIYEESEYNEFSYDKEYYDRYCIKCKNKWSKDDKYCIKCLDVIMYCDCHLNYIDNQ